VLRRACRDAATWNRAWPTEPPRTVSVNLSPRQFQQPDLVDLIAATLDETGLHPSTLVLEITESVLMQDDDVTTARLDRLKDLGVLLAIDDFGTGYSSLGYLRRFPIDILKIDKSFVDGVCGDTDDAELARTVVRLGQTLRLRTIAEGIEHEEQRHELREAGCHLGQGYLFSRPVPAPELEALLAAASRSPGGSGRRTAASTQQTVS
jgi:EAL domain-containing protein (putative c-di-GMP-specific phosphodiesterase class I)